MKKYIFIVLLFFFYLKVSAQIPSLNKVKESIESFKKHPVSISGTAGISYEGYGLTTNPGGYSFYTPRRPWNLVRFNFSPTITVGKFKLPFNFNFSPMRNNFGSTPFTFGSLPGFPKQTIGQWLTNPINNLGINPSYKWAELQLGTQYLKYSDLSTGDIGAFGYGFSLKPGKFRLKFFNGVSQRAFQSYTGAGTPPEFGGTYKRTVTMAQIGLEKEGVYFAGFNIVQSKDHKGSITNPLSIPTYTVDTDKPQENFIVSFNTKFSTTKGWYGQTELATTLSTRNAALPGPGTLVKDFKPFLNTNNTSYRDHALQAGFGKKGKDWDVGASMKWLGAGYNTMGYPFVQNDRMEYTINTKFTAFKKKTNVVASIGQRFGNWSTSSRTKQIIANVNAFTQFDDHFSVNANYNNFGFNTPALLGGIKNVGNDLGINPTYTWTTTKMTNLLSLNYNWSKYTEVILLPLASTTTNNTHTAMLLYAPVFFNKPNLSPDFSVMYFSNHSSILTDIKIISLSSSLGWNLPEKNINLRGQLQFNTTTINSFTPSKNLTATLVADWKITKKLTWNTSMTANGNKYGDELTPQPALLGATYLESTLRTGLQYRFGK
jgi:hypothetical protein